MSKIKNAAYFAIFAALLLLIWFGGPALSKMAEERFRKAIDKNGLPVKAIVTGKKYLKGYYVIFSYSYKGRTFSSDEQNRQYHDELEYGDSIEIKIDTMHPEDAYIIDSRLVND